MRRLVLLLSLCPLAALARSGGIAAEGCDGCHSGPGPASVTLTASPATFNPGQTTTLTATVSGPGSTAGIFLTAGNLEGTFSLISGEGLRLVGTGVVHSQRKALSGGQTTFRVQWTAPAGAPGGTDLRAYVVTGNGNGSSTGDAVGQGQTSLTYGCSGTTYWRDFDGDGVGATSSGLTRDCTLPTGYSTRDDDCDDNDRTRAPGAPEACNGRDDNCDGVADEGLSSAMTWPDADGDGSGARTGTSAVGCTASGRVTNDDDCDDTHASVNPGAAEQCNGLDDDCDTRVDDGVQARCGVGWCERLSPTCDPALCRPGSPSPERCNLLDDDCNGQVDDGNLCDAGLICLVGKCVLDFEPDPDADAGTGGPGVEPTSCCSATPGAMDVLVLWVAALALLARRRG